jgi:hypothetical protein
MDDGIGRVMEVSAVDGDAIGRVAGDGMSGYYMSARVSVVEEG